MRGTASTHQRRGGQTPEWLVEGTGEGVLTGDPGNEATSTLGTVSLLLGVGGPDEVGGVERVAHGPGKMGNFYLCSPLPGKVSGMQAMLVLLYL